MTIDILSASRRPLQRLLHDCRFSEWENIALFLDGGATEAVRWAGGLAFVLEELGISLVLDLQAFAPGRGGATRAPGSEGVTRGIFLVTTFVWDVEGSVLNAARTYGLTEVTLACSVSEEAHACHPHAAHISEETGGRVSFVDVSEQLNVSLVRMLKIDAQSSATSRHRFSAQHNSPSPPPSSSSYSLARGGAGETREALYQSPAIAPTEHDLFSSPDVVVSVVHSPIHLGCFFQPSTTPAKKSTLTTKTAALKGGGPQGDGCSAFSLASPACARVFPLRRCDWEGREDGGAGAALFAAAAAVAVEGGGGAEGDGVGGRMSAEDVPRDERLQYRLLAHSLAEVLWEQLLVDVSGSGGVFTLGDTSRLIGTTLSTVVEETKRASLTPDGGGRGGKGAVPSFAGQVVGSGGGISSNNNISTGRGVTTSRSRTDSRVPVRRREASVVLVDRTLDLAAAASRGGSLLQRILSSIPRTGATLPPSSSAVSTSVCSPPEEESFTAAAHQQDVGAILPALAPGLGLPAHPGIPTTGNPATGRDTGGPSPASGATGNDNNSSGEKGANRAGLVEMNAKEGGGDGAAGSRRRLLAMKALAGFSWPAPPSLCHPGSAAASKLVHLIASLPEEEGQAALVLALERCVSEHGCVPLPRKRRGMGSSIMALVTSLARGNPRAGGLTGDQVCFRCRAVVQVALAAMEAHQRTSAMAGSSWPETLAAERVQAQELRDGGTAEVVMEQLCDTLLAPSSTANRAGSRRGSVSVSDALVLSLRGVSLAGGSIGAEEATTFRRAWVSRMLAGGFREEGSGVLDGVAESVAKSLLRRQCTIGEGFGGSAEDETEEAGIRLELEDIARERVQRLREAAASRSHLVTPVLRDLSYEPYTFVASAPKTKTGTGAAGNALVGRGGERGGGGAGGEEEGWDDWGDDDNEMGNNNDIGDESSPVECSTECNTLVGRLAGLLLDPANLELPDLHEAKLMSAASVGLGLLSSGLKKFARIGSGGVRRIRNKNRPADRGVVVIFVVGGFTPLELAEVTAVLRCLSSVSATREGEEGQGGLETTEVILAGTTVSTPDVVYEQVFMRPPAWQ